MPKLSHLSVVLLASVATLHACSSSGQKSNAPAAPQAPNGDDEASEGSDTNVKKDDRAKTIEKRPFSKEKTEQRYQSSTERLLSISGDTTDADAQKILNEHFLAIECGTHVFGESWDGRRRSLLIKLLDTPEKQDAYVRAQSRLDTKIITLHDLSALDTLCR